MVLRAEVERLKEIVLLSSGMKILFLWMLGFLVFLPVGLNCVARVRFEYPPPTIVFLFVIGQTLDMVFILKHEASNMFYALCFMNRHVIIKNLECKLFHCFNYQL